MAGLFFGSNNGTVFPEKSSLAPPFKKKN